jgi:hypothetical protein
MGSSHCPAHLLAFSSIAITMATWSPAIGAPKSSGAGSLCLLAVTVGTHAENGTPDDWNYTAVELEQIVRSQCGPLFHEVKSKLVKGSQASPQRVLAGFEWLQKNVEEQDLALIYIGSHGGSDETRGFRLYANEGYVYGDEIKPALTKVKGRVILVVQSCCAGEILIKHRDDLEAMPDNVAAVCACRAGQHSHGIMLPPIMEALYGWADADRDSTVSVAEFLHYVKYRIGTFYPGKWAETQEAVTSEPQNFDLSTPLAKSVPQNEFGKELVMMEYKTDWYGGIVFPKNDLSKQHRHWAHWFGNPPGEEDWVENGRFCPRDAEPVIVKSGDKWYAAALLKHEGNRFHIRYIGVMDNKEEMVGRNRIQAYSLAGPPKRKRAR